MKKDYSFEHENLRKQMWITAWGLTASAITCPDVKTASVWADAALKDFDVRFPKPILQEKLD